MASIGRKGTLAFLVVSLTGAAGCGGMFANYGRRAESSSSSGGNSGAITVTNQTEHSICSIDVWQNGGEPRFQTLDVSSDPIGQGGSKTIELAGTAHSLRLVECGDEYVLWDSNPPQNNRAHNGISPDGRPFVLAESGASVEGNHLALERTPVSAYGTEAGSLQSEFGDAAFVTAREFASERRYSETLTGLTVTSSDWEINQNRNTGAVVYRWFRADVAARWPDGHCTIQGMAFLQRYDGSDFADRLETQGLDASSQRQVPCAAIGSMQSN